MDMIAKTASDIFAIVGDRFAIKQHQHAFKISQPVALPAPVESKSPLVVLYDTFHNDFLAKPAWAIGFIVPTQAFECVDDAAFKYLSLTCMELLKRTEEVAFVDGGDIFFFLAVVPFSASLCIHQAQHFRFIHEISPYIAINTAGNGFHGGFRFFRKPTVVAMPRLHTPVCGGATTDAVGQR